MDLKNSRVLVMAGVLWVGAAFGGGAMLLRYSVTAAIPGDKVPRWPGSSHLVLGKDKDSLVVAIHPRCPCTRASLVELNGLLLALKGKVQTTVLVVRPGEFPEEWARTDLLSSARRIPGVKVEMDPQGREAAKFGLVTSGQVALYDPKGDLMFNGGLTKDRGHVGDSPGRQRILALVKERKADKNDSLVFGCPLSAKACPMGEADKKNGISKGEGHVN